MSAAAAARFRKMADEIERCGEERFAGAMLLVPPGDGEGLEILLSDPAQKPENFWLMAKVRVETALAQIIEDENRKNSGPFGRR